jgi:hypothetical protein
MMGRERQGEHRVRPYNIYVGANMEFAPARTANGLETTYQLEGLS